MTSFTTKVVATCLSGTLLLAVSGAEAATMHHRHHILGHQIAFALQKAPRFSDTATLPEQCRPGGYWDMQKYSTDTPEMNSIPMPCHGFGS